MKQRISVKDLEALTDSQRNTLQSMWKPQKYDLVAAVICKDVENEVYEFYEFVVGGLAIFHYTHMVLYDIKALDAMQETESATDGQETSMNQNIETVEDDSQEDFSTEIDDTYPSSFNKEECVPLLSIGQMIEILQNNNYGKGDFYLYACTAEKGCEMGRSEFHMDNYGQEFENIELCDVLWDSVKALL